MRRPYKTLAEALAKELGIKVYSNRGVHGIDRDFEIRDSHGYLLFYINFLPVCEVPFRPWKCIYKFLLGEQELRKEEREK